jgi:hypothetical protein
MSNLISDETMQRIQEALFAGRKIEAIKIYRECACVGLKEAKDFVDAQETELRNSVPERFTAPVGGKGCFGVVVALGVLLGAASLTWA